MLIKKLGGFFALLGLLSFLCSWIYQRWFSGLPPESVMTAETAWEVGIYITVAFLLLGFFVSTLGMALVQEVLAERRGRDIEKKYRARANYDRMTKDSAEEGTPQ
ncbi:MAG: hypothetical protein LBU79_07450 [Planctomycetota bacterium]|jgi:vacuolar-type H+-ATPase subunit I/STV1|nr:hypothetical protein [Planctomycetota bacterium]